MIYQQDEALCSHKLLCYEYPPEWEKVEIYSLSDLHIGDPQCDVKAFRKFVQYIAESENVTLGGIRRLCKSHDDATEC